MAHLVRLCGVYEGHDCVLAALRVAAKANVQSSNLPNTLEDVWMEARQISRWGSILARL